MSRLLFLSAVIVFCLQLSCSTRRQTFQAEQGVVINGVRWATRNVDIPGRFTEKPEDSGMLYSWNSRQLVPRSGQPNRSAIVSESSTRWERSNNPCPRGWRVPTLEEFQSLIDAGSSWANHNGVYGRFFGFEGEQIFLPAVEQARNSSGRPQDLRTNTTNTIATYWSSTESTFTAYRLLFRQVGVGMGSAHKDNMFTVRCVADE